jgi:hypothetical protein
MGYQSKRAIWRSSITTQLLNLTLKRGGWLGGGGAFLLIGSGIFLPLPLLKILGIPLFVTGILLIAIGWLPYRKLVQSQLKPDEIHYDGSSLFFLRRGKPLFQIEERSIQKLAYLKKEEGGGIGVWLKKPVERKVKVLQPRFDYAAFSAWSYQQGACDLFFNYFSERSCEELTTQLGLDHAF